MQRVRQSLDKYQALVSRRLLDLVPAFLRNRRNEVESLRQALAKVDLEQLRQLAHRMQGVGGSYGPAHAAAVGRAREQCAREGDVTCAAGVGGDAAASLANVRVERRWPGWRRPGGAGRPRDGSGVPAPQR